MTEIPHWEKLDKGNSRSVRDILLPIKEIFEAYESHSEEFLVWQDALIDVRDLREREAELDEAKKQGKEGGDFASVVTMWDASFYHALKRDHITENRQHDPMYNQAYLVINAAAQSLENAYKKKGEKDPSRKVTLQLSSMEAYVRKHMDTE